MKKLFLNSQGYNTARLDLVVDSKPMSLYYHLNDNPVQHTWQQHLSSNLHYGVALSPVTAGTVAEWAKRLDTLVKKTELSFPITENVTQQELNDLHTMFVEYTAAKQFNDGLKEVWEDINVFIHIIETKLDNPLAPYNSTVRFNIGAGKVAHPQIQELHKHWVDSDHQQWGSLVLGYDTLGKDWSDVWYNNDISLLSDPTQLNVQSHIGLETWLSFDIENPWKKYAENKFYIWYNNLTVEQQALVPINNLNKIALGRYILGKLIITDELLKYNPNASDWYVPNHQCKLNWNKDIISKVSAVRNVEFFNSDLYYETLIKHTNTGNIFNA